MGSWNTAPGSGKNQESGYAIFVGSENKICHALGIKNRNFWYETWVQWRHNPGTIEMTNHTDTPSSPCMPLAPEAPNTPCERKN